MVAGLHGGLAVVKNFKLGQRGPEQIEGYASLQLDHPDALLKLAASQTPVVANDHAIGVGVGPSSATVAAKALDGKLTPAPLAVIAFDYGRMGDLLPADGSIPELELMRGMMKSFGLATFQAVADARDFVFWWSFELR